METKFAVPRVMEWTILPASVIAHAWLDEEFAEELTRNPEPILREASAKCPLPPNKSFRVRAIARRIRDGLRIA